MTDGFSTLKNIIPVPCCWLAAKEAFCWRGLEEREERKAEGI